MKYFLVIFFNAVAFYVLFAFIAGNGGMIDSAKKTVIIRDLELNKLESLIEIETLKKKLNSVQSLSVPNNEYLVMQGKKNGNMVIFKFLEQNKKEPVKNSTWDQMVLYRIYFSTVLVVIFIIIGNMIILFRFEGRKV